MSSTIRSQDEKYLEKIYALIRRASDFLASKNYGDTLLTTFNFPDELSVACEQYLIYFIQFLKDLGVEAEADLKHEAGKVLFSVKPTNEHDALEKVRDALEVYLNLPKYISSNPGIGMDLMSEPEVQRLVINAQHLNGQLVLAQSALQLKDATIIRQQITINHLFEHSLKNVVPPNPHEDREELLGGIVALKPYEAKGFEISLPKIFREMKKWFEKPQ